MLKCTNGQAGCHNQIFPDSGECQPGLYIHIPFCVTKCGYCSFSSFPSVRRFSDPYLASVVRQAAGMSRQSWVQARTFTTIYIGGGTPTIYNAESLVNLIATSLSLFNFVHHPEITVEINPDTVNFKKLTELRQGSVNRLSIGVQSFSDKILKSIGRSHSAAKIHDTINLARKAGFDNISFDLMYGLPEQRLKEWAASVDTALFYEPEHLSFYELTIEENTPFSTQQQQGRLRCPSEQTVVSMIDIALEKLEKAGYVRYEISNFCKPDQQSVHNVNYWDNGSYLGLGASAVSSLSGLRITNIADPDRYIHLLHQNISPFSEAESLSRVIRFRETVIMGLRMLSGVSLDSLRARFSLTPQEYYGDVVADLLQQGLLEINNDYLRLTSKSLPVANQVLAQLV